jgi:hypothetical protein
VLAIDCEKMKEIDPKKRYYINNKNHKVDFSKSRQKFKLELADVNFTATSR